MEQLEFTATENEAGVRIDRCLSDKYEELSRSYLQKLLKEQGVTVNGKAVKANYKIQEVCHEKGPRFFLSHIPVQKPQYPQRCPERQALHQTVKLTDLIICHSG